MQPHDWPDWFAFFEPGDETRRPPRLSRRRLLRLLAGGGAVATGAALFGGGFLTRLLTEGSASGGSTAADTAAMLLPAEGVAIEARWGGLLPRLVELGVVDPDRFEAAAQRSGAGLTIAQRRILRDGSDEPVHIDSSSGRFVLNALWAVGLANRNPILSQGPMSTLDPARQAQLASTAGWTLGKQPGPEYLGRFDLIPLSSEQQAVLNEVTMNSYRPCCDNPTAFPDCNHGAAALGLAELAASKGASADEIFRALKGFNSFWYPDRYYVLARHFDRRGTSWNDVDPRLVLSADYSTLTGWQRVAAQLQQEEPIEGLPGRGGGCAA